MIDELLTECRAQLAYRRPGSEPADDDIEDLWDGIVEQVIGTYEQWTRADEAGLIASGLDRLRFADTCEAMVEICRIAADEERPSTSFSARFWARYAINWGFNGRLTDSVSCAVVYRVVTCFLLNSPDGLVQTDLALSTEIEGLPEDLA
jgi:hypothetical protein